MRENTLMEKNFNLLYIIQAFSSLDILKRIVRVFFALIEELALQGNLEMPHGKKFIGQKNLYEIRYRRHRVLYCYDDDQVISLHTFIKKTQETPKKDINLAIERQKDFE